MTDAHELQRIEQGMEQFAMQRKGFQAQLQEVEAALAEIRDDGSVYRIIGSLMVKKDPKMMREELNERKETLSVRIRTVEKQEEKLRGQLKDAQAEVMKNMKKK